MRVSVLGRLVAATDDSVVDLQAGQRAAVLVFLALRAGHHVETDEMIDALWGDRPVPTARNAVQVHVAALRRLLGRDAITSRGTAYRCAAAPDDVDALALEEQVRSVDEALARGDMHAASTLTKAWNGELTAEPLPGLSGVAAYVADVTAWLADIQRRGRTARVRVLLEADPEQALPDAAALAREHPFDEGAQARHIDALRLTGRRQEALQRWAVVRTGLRDELGVEPGEALREVQRRVLMEAPDQRDRSRWAAPVPTGRLLGRTSELAVLEEWERSGSALGTVCGVPGVGKTALVTEHVRRANGAVFWVRCDPEGGVEAQQAFLAVTGHGVDSLARLPVVLPWLLEDDQPLVVLDDVAPRDPSLAGLLDALLAVPDLRVLVTSWESTRHPAERLLRLDGLDVDGQGGAEPPALELLRGRMDELGAASTSLQDAPGLIRVVRRLEGMPLPLLLAAHRLVVVPPARLVPMLDDGADVLSADVDWLVTRHRSASTAMRLATEHLEVSARRLLEQVAAFPAGAPLDAFAADREVQLVADLVTRGLLSVAADAESASRMRLPYLVRQVVTPEPSRLVEWAVRLLGRPIVPGAVWPQRLATVRRCSAEGPNMVAAVRAALVDDDPESALTLVIGGYSLWLALGETAQALPWIDDLRSRPGVADADLLDLALLRAWLLHGLERVPEAMTERESVLALADRVDDPNRLVVAACAMAWDETDQEPGWLVARLLELSPRVSDPDIRILIDSVLAAASDDPVAGFAELRRQCRRHGRDHSESIALMNLGLCAIRAGGHPQGVEWGARALELAQRAGSRLLVALAQIRLGGLLVLAGRPAEATPLLLEALRETAAQGAAPSAGAAVCFLSAAERARGRRALGAELERRWRARLVADARDPWPDEVVLVDATAGPGGSEQDRSPSGDDDAHGPARGRRRGARRAGRLRLRISARLAAPGRRPARCRPRPRRDHQPAAPRG